MQRSTHAMRHCGAAVFKSLWMRPTGNCRPARLERVFDFSRGFLTLPSCAQRYQAQMSRASPHGGACMHEGHARILTRAKLVRSRQPHRRGLGANRRGLELARLCSLGFARLWARRRGATRGRGAPGSARRARHRLAVALAAAQAAHSGLAGETGEPCCRPTCSPPPMRWCHRRQCRSWHRGPQQQKHDGAAAHHCRRAGHGYCEPRKCARRALAPPHGARLHHAMPSAVPACAPRRGQTPARSAGTDPAPQGPRWSPLMVKRLE